MSNLIKIEAPELVAIEKSKAAKIKETFDPMAEMLEGFEKEYSDIIAESEKEITYEITAKAKRLRLDVGKVRIETGKLKDKQKEYIKLEDKAIMGVHNILVWAVKEKEDKLKEIENFFEIQEQKRLETLQAERVEMLSKFVEDAQERNLSSMDCDVWEAYYQTKKKDYTDRIEAEKKAEKDRIAAEKAEIERQKAIELENSKLKAEREANEKKQEAERLERERLAKIEAEQIAKVEARRKELERIEREKYEAKLKSGREEKERIERELKAKIEAEQKVIQEAEALKQSELNKGDAAKVQDLISDLEALKVKYSFKSAQNQKMYSNVGNLLTKVVDFINQ